MEKVIRWGIAGPGNIANKFAKAIKNVKGALLVAVAARSEEKGKAFADKYDIPMVFAGYEEMAKSDEIDAVYIATPHPLHKPCAEIYLKAKKHVLCEKPICVNAEDAKSLKACAKENNVFLMEAMWTRFLPAVTEAVNIAKSGRIGKVKSVSADFCYSDTPDGDAKIFRNDMAGGSLLDVGVYSINMAAMLFGSEPESIVSSSDVDNGVDLHTTALLKYKAGEIANVTSAITVQKPYDAYIHGTDGYIHIPMFYGAKDFYVCTDDSKEHILKPSIGDGFEEEIYEACKCINENKLESDIMPLDETIRILEIMDDIRAQIGLKYSFDK